MRIFRLKLLNIEGGCGDKWNNLCNFAAKFFIILFKMNKFKLAMVALLFSGNAAFAGGFLTNTNQSVLFLRNPARDAAIGIDGVYTNPAGVAFMNEGWHLSFNWQNAHQTRTINSAYGPLFAYNAKAPVTPDAEGLAWREFEGVAHAPFLPSLQAAYNTGKWSFQFNVAVSGGGGKCEFDNGLGSLEGLVASQIVPNAQNQQMQQQLAASRGIMLNGQYALDSYMKGRQYYFGTTLGAAYKLNENLSVYGGLRVLYGTARYEGYVKNIQMGVMPVNPGTGQPMPDMAQLVPAGQDDIELDCKQSAMGVAPILGVDYKIGKLNLAAKYDFKVRMRLKNDTSTPVTVPQLAKYADENVVAEDSPALFAFGAQYEITDKWRVMAGYHHFFDVDTKQWTKDMVGDTNEFNVGTEYDITDWLQVSGGLQKTNYDQTDGFMNDISFNVSSYTFGLGFGVKVCDNVKLNAAYFQTNYDTYKKTEQVSTITVKNNFTRTNRVFGIGVEWDF